MCQIVQHLAALTNHHQQATTGVVVVLVGAQVISQFVDASGQDSNLNLGRNGVALVSSVLQDNLGLLFLLDHCVFHLSKIVPGSQVMGGWCTFYSFLPKLSNGHKNYVRSSDQPDHHNMSLSKSKGKFSTFSFNFYRKRNASKIDVLRAVSAALLWRNPRMKFEP